MRCLITGGSGLLGSYLVPLLRKRFNEVWAPSHQHFNILKPARDILDEHFDCVVNLAALVPVATCEENPEVADLTNNLALYWLSYLPKTTQIYHISTDYVYDGNTPNSKETHLLNPWCVYGRTKAAGDTRLLSTCSPNIHIIRTSFKPIKWPYPGAFENVYTNADTVDVIAALIFKLILSNPAGGVYNVGTKPKSLYNLAKKNNPDILPITFSEEKFPTVRPHLTMSLCKFRMATND